MKKLYTIGFTKKTAQNFFELLQLHKIDIILDIRLSNSSQLSGFSKYPDIKYFLRIICDIVYIHDKEFAPTKDILYEYKHKNIDWKGYSERFDELMKLRNIDRYIYYEYNLDKTICLLCSEELDNNCHRSLVADRFKKIFPKIKIFHI